MTMRCPVPQGMKPKKPIVPTRKNKLLSPPVRDRRTTTIENTVVAQQLKDANTMSTRKKGKVAKVVDKIKNAVLGKDKVDTK